jgi:hypothetical protein
VAVGSESRQEERDHQISPEEEHAEEEIRSQSLDLSAWTNSHWIPRKVHETSFEVIETDHRQG